MLDLAGGTGDLARLFADRVGPSGEVVLTDINGAMLAEGRDKLLNEGAFVPVVQCDAQRLPFPDRRFDCVSIAFGLRNVTRKEARARRDAPRAEAGRRRARCSNSRASGRRSRRPTTGTASTCCPRLGKLVAGDDASYRYLAESIRMHPDQETLKAMMEQAGFDRVEVHNLAAGVVAVHRRRAY